MSSLPFEKAAPRSSFTTSADRHAGAAARRRSPTTRHMIVTVRKQLLKAVKRHRDTGEIPPNVDDVTLDRVRSASMMLEQGADWRTASADVRHVDGGRPVAAVVPLILPTPGP
jgi:hypothetical protein